MAPILLIEDNQSNADMVIRILNAGGYQVVHGLTGMDGLNLARETVPALILIDFDLPDIDARTLILTLKKQLGGENAPPLVALTARTGDAEMEMAARFGCAAFVSKPFNPQELTQAVGALLAVS